MSFGFDLPPLTNKSDIEGGTMYTEEGVLEAGDREGDDEEKGRERRGGERWWI